MNYFGWKIEGLEGGGGGEAPIVLPAIASFVSILLWTPAENQCAVVRLTE